MAQPKKMSTCRPSRMQTISPRATTCRSRPFRLSTSRTPRSRLRVTHLSQTSSAANPTRPIDPWKRTILTRCLRDGTEQIIFFHRSMSRILLKKIQISIAIRKLVLITSTTLSTPSPATFVSGASKKHFKCRIT